jgi:glycosyltransferase involved in cell wall biosynthesis
MQHPWLQLRKLVLFGGTLGRANGVGYLGQLAAAMKVLDPDVRFVVIGDGAERTRIAAEAQEAGVLDVSFFMFPGMPKIELAVWVAACDFTVGLFAGPRVVWKDAVQNKFFDSLAAGKPVACNFAGFQSELAVQNGIGLIMPNENPEHAAQLLLEKLSDPKWMSQARRRALDFAEGEFSRDRLASKLEVVLQLAVCGRKSRAI